MRDIDNVKEAKQILNEFERKTNTLLMIDGQTLDIILKDSELEEKFLATST